MATDRPRRADERDRRHLTETDRAELLAALLAERYQLTAGDLRKERS